MINKQSEKLALMNIQANNSVKNKPVEKMTFDEYLLEEFWWISPSVFCEMRAMNWRLSVDRVNEKVENTR